MTDLETVAADCATVSVSIGDRADGVVTVTLSRPDARNALDAQLREEFSVILATIEDDDRSKVVVLTGDEEGGAFVAGADVTELRERNAIEQREVSKRPRIYETVADLSKPVIARINGHALGGGLELALACDVRIAAPDATLGFPEHNIGLIPGLGGCSQFVHLVGPGTAKDMIFSKELIGGERAREIRLVERVESNPEDTARAYAESLLDQPPQALGLAKRVVNAARDTDTRSAGLLESLAQSTLIETDDHREGVDAFREKRDPEFSGE